MRGHDKMTGLLNETLHGPLGLDPQSRSCRRLCRVTGRSHPTFITMALEVIEVCVCIPGNLCPIRICLRVKVPILGTVQSKIGPRYRHNKDHSRLVE